VRMLRAIVVAIVAELPAVPLYGARRWRARTHALRARLEAARLPVRPSAVEFHELEGLPAPVQRCFRTALEEGQPLVSAVSVEHTGSFNMSDSGERWRPFTSTQRVALAWLLSEGRRPYWRGRITKLAYDFAWSGDVHSA